MTHTLETPGVSSSRGGLPAPDTGVGGHRTSLGVETVLGSTEVGPTPRRHGPVRLRRQLHVARGRGVLVVLAVLASIRRRSRPRTWDPCGGPNTESHMGEDRVCLFSWTHSTSRKTCKTVWGASPLETGVGCLPGVPVSIGSVPTREPLLHPNCFRGPSRNLGPVSGGSEVRPHTTPKFGSEVEPGTGRKRDKDRRRHREYDPVVSVWSRSVVGPRVERHRTGSRPGLPGLGLDLKTGTERPLVPVR